jgi:hypothetical protein
MMSFAGIAFVPLPDNYVRTLARFKRRAFELAGRFP